MLNKRLLISILAILFTQIACNSCRPKDPTTNFDSQSQREGYLKNLADNYISPELVLLKTATSNLVTATDSFAKNRNLSNLENAQQAYDQAYMQYLRLDAFRFGAFENQALTVSLFNYIGSFLVDSSEIEAKITAEYFNTDDTNYKTKGFGVTEYLLFNYTNDQNKLISNFSDPKRIAYLQKNSIYIDSLVGLTLANWNIQKNTFSQSASIDQGSNLYLLFNSLNASFETAKNDKVRLPGGYIAVAPGIILETSIESYHAGYSKKYLKQHMTALKSIWFGNTGGNSQIGFDDIVIAQTHDSAFVKSTEASFNRLIASIDALPNQRLDLTIKNQNDSFKVVYDNMVDLIKYIKSGMNAQIGLISSSADSDND